MGKLTDNSVYLILTSLLKCLNLNQIITKSIATVIEKRIQRWSKRLKIKTPQYSYRVDRMERQPFFKTTTKMEKYSKEIFDNKMLMGLYIPPNLPIFAV